jgi:glucose/arabinose dehydrogenase
MRLGFLVLLGLVGATPAFADETVRAGASAFGDWRTDAPGVRRLITPADLPAPYATRSTANMSHQEARTEADVPKAPSGFAVEQFATGLNMPRVIRVAPNGDVFVAETGAGSVRVFRPGAGSGPAKGEIFTAGLQRPCGIAFYPSGENPRFVMSRRRTPLCAFPIAAET